MADANRTTPLVRVARLLRANLFANWWSGLLTLFALYLFYRVAFPVFEWAFLDAVWHGATGRDCRSGDGRVLGACWPFIKAKWGQIFYGQYPAGQRWRVDLTYVLGALGLIMLAVPAVPRKRLSALYLFAIFPVLAFFILTGGAFGLPVVETALWGGLMLTIVIASCGMAISLPAGILLALGRRSHMPVVRILSVLYIEFWRGVPLVTVLFIASVLLPLFLKTGVSVDKLLRAMFCFSLFASAYMAEVVRGGLQAVDKGQFEAARAVGLGYWRTQALVVLPQALTSVIPGIVNTFIGLFKDTTLVLIIGLADLLNILQISSADAKWAAPQTAVTGYVFAAALFWVFCYSMSLYSRFMERRLAATAR